MGLINKLFYESSQWSIGIIPDFEPHDLLHNKIENIYWISPVKYADFYADPILTNYFGEPIVYLEEFVGAEKKGRISYIKVNDVLTTKTDKIVATPVLDFSTHLSFPYLFEYDGHLYMVPENYQSNTITIYEAGSTPDIWHKKTVLMDNFPGIDTVIFYNDNLWWMFSTKYDFDSNTDNRYELYIWYSDSPLGGWKPHLHSPIQSDKPIIRAAGVPFVVNGNIYRPSQDCISGYGKGIYINEIIELTTKVYSEEKIMRLSPIKPYKGAFHTYSSTSGFSVIDGIKGRYTLMKPLRYLYRKYIK